MPEAVFNQSKCGALIHSSSPDVVARNHQPYFLALTLLCPYPRRPVSGNLHVLDYLCIQLITIVNQRTPFYYTILLHEYFIGSSDVHFE